ncbi:nucleic-acid-binding protein from transposon X-element [Caerostris darwini]|uniref:Nucleic-acid-binding protein from transposon X-element n=1 Tax=Caerostris darwini TaxID=1538125 RepID=A0AAV4UTD8_9ARAC|nr:nucleic-acid-binding protein from transposon X-element [Caerostris darwini]
MAKVVTTPESHMDIDQPVKNQKTPRTPDSEGFIPPSRRLTAQPNTEQETERPIEAENQFAVLETTTESENFPEQTQMKTRLPPFFILPDRDWPQLYRELKSQVPSMESSLSRGQFFKITIEKEEEYSTLKTILTQRKIPFRTNNLRKDRPLKVVLRGIPPCTDKNLIISALSTYGNTVLDVIQMTNLRSKRPMPLFLIKIANSINAEEIFKINSLLGLEEVSIERFRGSNTASQCRNCYGFYHSSETCHLKPRCAHCAAEHSTTECTQAKESTKTCVNCKGSHVAYWRGCPGFPKKRYHESERKPEVIEKVPIKDPENFPQLQTSHTPTVPAINNGTTYANITASKPYRQQITPTSKPYQLPITPTSKPCQLPITPTSKSYRQQITPTSKPCQLPITPTSKNSFHLMAQILPLLHQEGINGPALLKAFRSALPELQTTENPDEKSCIILEHYGALIFN